MFEVIMALLLVAAVIFTFLAWRIKKQQTKAATPVEIEKLRGGRGRGDD